MTGHRSIGFMQSTATSLLNELRQLRLTGPRAWLCIETVAAVVLAVTVAEMFHLKERWWVALSAYTIVRADFGVSVTRCMQRVGGTAIGALCGFAVAPLAISHGALFALMLGLIAAVGVYGMLGSSHAYSWILGTITALMIVSQAHGDIDVGTLALTRFADVVVGVASALLVVVLAEAINRWHRDKSALQGADPAVYLGQAQRSDAAQTAGSTIRKLKRSQALVGSLCIACLGAVDYYQALPSFAQALVSIVAVLFVPMPALLQGDRQSIVFVRMFNRMLGCSFAALIAIVLLPLIGNIPVLCAMALACGIWVAAHVQTGSSVTSYIGTQFGIGFIMVFVQDHEWSTDASAAVYRLAGMLIGLGSLAVFMLAATVVRRYVAMGPQQGE